MADRKHISTETKLRLFSEAAGHCQRPDCLCPLFPVEMGGDKHIAEMAHVISHGDAGPRHSQRPVGAFQADSFENLILLCPTCHTIVDKDPDGYSRATLLSWKNSHLAALAHQQGIRAYDERGQVRQAVLGIMEENKFIWDEFAPSDGSRFEYDPESEAAKTWEQRVRGVILPNHFRIQAIVRENSHHMTEVETRAFAQYQEHVRGLSERHVCGVAGAAIRYPPGMNGIFK
ncbi:HNH endonuclease [Xanthomonas arboricola]|uniref:HNH endonuclease n=1 Tax=Xanthomonas arboricola TaxID=56448 RepID=UPI0039F54094